MPITDPGGGDRNPFTLALSAQGYHVTGHRSGFDEGDTAPFRGRLLGCSCGAATTAAPENRS